MQKEIANWLKATGTVVIASALAVMPNSTQMLTTYEYQKETMRGGSELSDEAKKSGQKTTGLDKDYAYQWSEGKQESFTLLIPRLMGGASYENIGESSKIYKEMKETYGKDQAQKMAENFPGYHGDQTFTSGTIYFGAIIVFLAVFGFFIIEGAMKWWLISGAAVSLMMSWGSNFPAFNYFFFDNVPLFNKFRSVSMWLSITSLMAVISAVFALHQFLSNTDEVKAAKHKKYLYISGAIVGAICLYFWMVGLDEYTSPRDAEMLKSGYPEELVQQIVEQREDLSKGDALRSLLFIAMAFGALYAYTTKKVKAEYIALVLTVLCVIDIVPFDKNFFPKEKFQKVAKHKDIEIEATPADKFILQDKSLNYRVLNLTGDVFNEANTSYFHKSIGGYHPAKLRRYQDLIENYIPQEAQAEAQKAAKGDTLAFASANVLNMLNSKYIILAPQAEAVVKNKFALGNAWFIDTLKSVKNAKEEIDGLAKLNPKRTALISEEVSAQLKTKKKEFSSKGSIELISYEPNRLEYNVDAVGESFAVFSEIYYPFGWKASIDGNEVEHVRVNYALRGLEIHAGKHKVSFVFEPDSFKLGKTLSSASSLIILLMIGAVAFLLFKKRKEA